MDEVALQELLPRHSSRSAWKIQEGDSGQQSHDVRSRKGCKDPRLLEDVGSVGDLSKGRERADADET